MMEDIGHIHHNSSVLKNRKIDLRNLIKHRFLPPYTSNRTVYCTCTVSAALACLGTPRLPKYIKRYCYRHANYETTYTLVMTAVLCEIITLNNYYHSLYSILNFDWLIYMQITVCKYRSGANNWCKYFIEHAHFENDSSA
jgi:hypothetical protein